MLFLQRKEPLSELVRYAIRLSGTSCTWPTSSISGCCAYLLEGQRESPIGKQQFNGSIGENTCARSLISIQVERKIESAVFSSMKYLVRFCSLPGRSAIRPGREVGGRLFWLQCVQRACRLWVAQCLRFNNKNTRYTTTPPPPLLAGIIILCIY